MLKHLKLFDMIENNVEITNNINEAIYILSDGTLFSGGFYCNMRCIDHREVEVFTQYDRYDGNKFWDEVTISLGLIMIVPENKMILINPKHIVTDMQKKAIDRAKLNGYSIEVFE